MKNLFTIPFQPVELVKDRKGCRIFKGKNEWIIFSFMKFFLPLLLLISFSANAIETILENGKETEKLLKTGSFSWTAVHGNVKEKHFEVEVYKTPDFTRLDMYFVFENEKQHMSTTYMGEKFWYLSEDGFKGKFRPYEVPYSMPTSYYYLMKSKVQVVNRNNISFLGELKSKENGVYKFSREMSTEEKEAIRKRVDFIRNKLLPSAESRAEEKFYYRQAKQLLDYAKDGKINLVEEKSGIVTLLDTPDGSVQIKNFQFITIADKEYVTPNSKFEDFTNAPDKENIVFLSHNAKWQPGMANFQTDGRILNLESKAIRRIPFRGAVSTPHCFDSKTGTLFITGVPLGTNDVRPFAINLLTGQQAPLGGSYFNQGHTNQLALSPDGKLVAAVHRPNPAVSPQSDLVIIDSVNKKIKKYTLNHLTSKVVWHPNNKNLYIQSFNEKEKTNEISIFEPGSGMKKILNGVDLIYLKDQNKLLFLDSKDQKWKTASLEGKDINEVSDGLQKLQYPAYGKSSNEILMIKEDKNNMPVPVLYDFLSKSSLRITEKKGLWLTPVWR